jgi:hypothetical protein
MLTDEALIQELEAAFRDETEGLRYAGRVPSPRRPVVPWTAVPIAAATAAVVVLPQLGGGARTAAPTPPDPGHSASASARPSSDATKVVTRKVSLASFQAAVAHAGDDWPPLTLQMGIQDLEVPADAVPVDGVAAPSKAWTSTDPDTGLAVLWLTAPMRNQGWTFAASGEGWSEEQLIQLLLTGERG